MKINKIFNEDEDIGILEYLKKCGIDDVKGYLNPSAKYIEDPYLYKNMRDGIQMMKYHILQKSKIYIIQDGDFDGISSTVILYQYLKLIEPELNIKILLHDGKLRGLGDKKILNEILNNPRELVIIPDAGSNEVEQTRKVFENDSDVLVFDHHNIETPIDCGILINNQLQECNKSGSGCLVTHKFLKAMDIEYNVNYSNKFVDLVAMSIISDSCNMKSLENRTFVKFGLFNHKNIKNPFLIKLIEDYIYKDDFTVREISFNVVPKINSTTRTSDQVLKQRLIKAFLGMDDLEEVSKLCGESHKNQIEIVDNFIKDNKDSINEEDNVIVVCSENLQRSYSGLVAGKLSGIYNRPCIVCKDYVDSEELIGSLRSNVPMMELLNSREEINWNSGHSKAMGISIKKSKLSSLKEYLNTIDINYEDITDVLQSYRVNTIPNKLYGLYEPYNTLWSGQGVPKPQFHIHSIKFNSKDIQIIGKKKNTLKLVLDNVTIMYFNSNEQVREDFCIDNPTDLELEVICDLTKNEWNGRFTNQIIINKYEIKEYIKEEKTFEDLFG